MKNTIRLHKFVAALLVAFLLLGALPVSAASDTEVAYAVENGNIYFDKETGMITGCDDTVTRADIPAEIDGVAVTGIGEDAFYRRRNLTEVIIPESVTSIASGAFLYSYSLSCIKVDANNAYYSSDEYGVLFNKDKTELILCPDKMLESYTIPDGVVTIGEGAFGDCMELTAVEIPDSVVTIGDTAFCNTSLESIEIPDSVTTIGPCAFMFCTCLTEVVIPNSVTSVGAQAFDYCMYMTNITIGSGVTSIGVNTEDYHFFAGCDELACIWVDEDNPVYSSDECGVLFNKDKTELLYCPRAFSGNYSIPDGVVTIGAYAFYDCNNLTSVTIPNSVNAIGAHAFGACFDLASVTIPNSVNTIGAYAFYSCYDLTSVTIPRNVTTIGEGTFLGCSGLTSITIPVSVTSIGNKAFYNCDNLTDVYFCGDAPSVGDYAFYWYVYGTGKEIIPGLTLYYLEGKEGWTSPTWEGYPTAIWEGSHEHTYTAVVTAPTCGEAGYTTYTCACGDSYTADEVAATGHSYELTASVAATCTEDGAKTYTCACGDTYSETVAATGHSHQAVVTAPTCGAAGYTTYTCACGDSYTADEVAATGNHSFGEWVTGDGVMTRTCGVCGHEESQEIAVQPDVNDGFVSENGGIYHYEDGELSYAGLIEVDGNYYYVRTTTGEVICGRSYWITYTNDLMVAGSYTFDEQGRMIIEEEKDGFVAENGGIYHYENGKLSYAGLIYVDGYYYYVRTTTGEVVCNRTYWITYTNDLMPAGAYAFDAQGRMILDETKDGFVEENGSIYHYENGKLSYAGLIYVDGYYYYVRTTTSEVVCGRSYWITYTNDLLPAGSYTFDSQGRMILG